MFNSKRKSGNGSSRRQWLYLYVHLPAIFLVKIGISGDYRRRAKQVAKHSPGWPVPVFAVKIPFAWQCEQAMHRLFRIFNVHFGGSKEWYFFPVIPMALLIMVVAFVLDWAILIGFATLLVWWFHH